MTRDRLTNGTKYAFEVRALNLAGGGDPVRLTATPAVLPGAPRNLEAQTGDGEVTLTWQAPSDPGTFAVTGYEYRHAEGDSVPSETEWASAGTGLTVKVGSLTNGTAYAFQVRAVSDAGGGEPAGATATPATEPGPPQEFVATPGDGQVTLRWKAPADAGGSPVTGYEYRHAEGATVPEETVWTSAGTDLTATIGSLTNGTLYAFEVRAANGAGPGEAAALAATPTVLPTAPSVPRNLEAVAGDGQVRLTWQVPASDGGSPVTGYEYRYGEGATVPEETAWQSAGTDLTATIGSLTNGTAYAFEVRAVSDVGESEAASMTATPATEPGPPQNLAATPGDGAVTLRWEAPASNGGSAVTGYEYRHAEGTSVPTESAWQSAGTDLTATIGNLTNGTAYTFEVRAVNDVGESEAASTTVTPATEPGPPQNLAATPGDGAVTLRWEAAASNGGSAVTGYEYRHGEGAAVPEETAWQSAGTDLTATIDSLTNGTLYAFEVRAVSDVGESEAASTTVTPATVPGPPQEFAATPGDGQVGLRWKAPADNGGSAMTGYEYRHAEGTSVPTETAWQSAGMDLTATIGNLTNGTTYTFEVRAVNDVGESEAASTTVTPATVPGPPQEFAATPGDGQVGLRWKAPADNGGSSVTGYEYRHAEGATVPEETAWQSAGTDLTATIGSLTNGTAYTFEVRAVNDVGPGESAALAATPDVVPTAPSVPQNLAAEPGAGQVRLRWEAPASNGGSAVTGYEYRHAEGAAVPEETAWQSAGTDLTATIGSLTNGTAYTFEVRAVNDVGPGESAALAATPDVVPTAPSVPQNLAAEPGAGQVRLRWEAPASNGGSAVTGYEYRHAEGAAVPEETAWQSAGTDLTATIGSLTNGTAYTFEVRAVNDVGPGESAALAATPDVVPTAPSVPQNLAAEPGDGQVRLRWEAPASNGGSAVTGYEYRHAEGAAVPEETAWQSAGTDLTATIGSLTNGTAYTFEVRAVSDAGESEPAKATATPATVPGPPQEFAATPGDGQVTLRWKAPADNGGSAVAGYEYRHGEGSSVAEETAWTSVGTALTVTVGSLANDTQYAFQVRAVNAVGEGEIAALTATPAVQATTPSAPRNLEAEAGDGEVKLTWAAPSSDGGSAVAGYEYRHGEGSSVADETAWTSVGTALTVTVGSLANDTQYAFQVRAVNAVGEGEIAALTAMPAVQAMTPGAPRNLKATLGDRKVTLDWEPPAVDGGTAVDGYEYRYVNGDAAQSGTQRSLARIAADPPSEGRWIPVGMERKVTVDSLENGAEFAFEVRAVNEIGPGPAARVTIVPAAAPDAPRDLRAIPGDRKVTLIWKPPANDGGSPVRLYLYRYGEGAAVPDGTQWESVQNALTVTIENLTNGTQYAFEVLAVSSGGNSAAARATATPFEPPTVAELQRHIAGFMLRRANALASNQPRVTRFLKAGSSGNNLAGQATELGGAVRGALHYRNVWLNVQGAWSAAAGSRSHYVFGTLGGHLRLNEHLLAGVMLQFDMADETLPGDAGRIDGRGWLIGPYFAAKLEDHPLFFEGRLLYGRTDNRLVHAKGVSGGFGTARWLAQLRVEGEVGLESGLTLTPFGDLLWTQDRQRSFRDSLGRRVGGQAVAPRQAKAGIDFRLPLRARRGALALTGGIEGVYSATDGSAAVAGYADGRVRLALGLDYRPSATLGVALDGFYDGIGTPDYRSYGLGGTLKIRF